MDEHPKLWAPPWTKGQNNHKIRIKAISVIVLMMLLRIMIIVNIKKQC